MCDRIVLTIGRPLFLWFVFFIKISYQSIFIWLGERSIPVEHMQQQSSGITGSSVSSFRQTGISSVPASPNRSATHEQSSGTNLTSSIGENGSLFTLTNIYTFGGSDGNCNTGLSDDKSDKYRIKSFVEVFNQPSSNQDTEYERHYRETHSSSSITRKIRTSATDIYDYDQNGNYDSSQYQHQYEKTGPSSTKYIHGKWWFNINITSCFNLYDVVRANDLFIYLTFV